MIMAKKKEKPPEEGSPAWMATFSDLMNLLLCFFVLLFASSSTDAEKIMQIVASFDQASFSILEAGSISLVDGQIVSGGVTQLPGIESLLEYIGMSSESSGNNEDMSATGSDEGKEDSDNQPDSIEMNTEEVIQEMTGGADSDEQSDSDKTYNKDLSEQELKEQLTEMGLEQSEEMYDEISELSESYDIDDRIVMDYNSQYVSLDLNGAILFDAGSAEVRRDAQVFMQRISSILGKYKDSVIEIEGHTDNIPIHSAQYESNLYLSTARASKVCEFVLDHSDLDAKNIKVAGYGENRPVASNATEEGRAKNRRVSIKIYNQLSSDVN